jgi:hypothetical protein
MTKDVAKALDTRVRDSHGRGNTGRKDGVKKREEVVEHGESVGCKAG